MKRLLLLAVLGLVGISIYSQLDKTRLENLKEEQFSKLSHKVEQLKASLKKALYKPKPQTACNSTEDRPDYITVHPCQDANRKGSI